MSKRKADGDVDGERASFGKPDFESGDDKAKQFAIHLRALNRQFAKWVEGQASIAPGEFWLDGVQDYVKHAEGLKSKFSTVLSSTPAPAPAPAFAFGSAPAPAPAPAKKEEPLKATFAFGAAAQATAAGPAQPLDSAKPAFGSAPPATFSFGAAAKPAEKPADEPTTAPAPAFGAFGGFGAAKPGGEAPSMFGGGGKVGAFGGAFASGASSPFGSLPGSAAVSTGTNLGDGEEGEGDDPTPAEPTLRAEKNAEDSAERLFEAKAKVFFQAEDKTWNEIGAGLTIVQRIPQEEKTVTSVVFRDEITGKVKINCPLYRGIKALPSPGKPKMMVVTVYIEVQKKRGEEMVMEMEKKTALFRFGQDDKAAAFKKAIDENAPL